MLKLILIKKKICDINSINIELINNNFIYNILNYINYFVVSIIIIFYILFIYVIVIAAWTSFANVFNYIFYGIYYIISQIYILTYRIYPNFDYKNVKKNIIDIHQNALNAELIWNRSILLLSIWIKRKKLPIVILVLLSFIIIFFVIIYVLYENLKILKY